jgi:hypothetical protein
VPDPTKTAAAYNTQDNPGGPAPGTGLVYEDFVIDATGLAAGLFVHFDFYTIGEVTRGKSSGTKILDFAPFSHDAQSNGHRVPDAGTTLALLGTALAVLESTRRRLARN